ncbi:hypothetical protein B0H19DRAFT_1258759 [Mycena capillaripes]|nr:hypothetical protein B0H19DRAFT_1258759 [Mycena capillaripes]
MLKAVANMSLSMPGDLTCTLLLFSDSINLDLARRSSPRSSLSAQRTLRFPTERQRTWLSPPFPAPSSLIPRFRHGLRYAWRRRVHYLCADIIVARLYYRAQIGFQTRSIHHIVCLGIVEIGIH